MALHAPQIIVGLILYVYTNSHQKIIYKKDPFACKSCDNSRETSVGPLSYDCISCNPKHYLSPLATPSSCLPVCYNTLRHFVMSLNFTFPLVYTINNSKRNKENFFQIYFKNLPETEKEL